MTSYLTATIQINGIYMKGFDIIAKTNATWTNRRISIYTLILE